MKYQDKQIWAIYNHIPGGQIIATHFERTERKKRVDNQDQVIVITPIEQFKNYEKSEFVALNLNGVITRNKLLMYSEDIDLSDDPRAADRVIEWAIKKGVASIRTPEEKIKQELMPSEQARKIDVLEAKIINQDEKLDKIIRSLEISQKKS